MGDEGHPIWYLASPHFWRRRNSILSVRLAGVRHAVEVRQSQVFRDFSLSPPREDLLSRTYPRSTDRDRNASWAGGAILAVRTVRQRNDFGLGWSASEA